MLVYICEHDWGILMGSMLPYIAYMDPMGKIMFNMGIYIYTYIHTLNIHNITIEWVYHEYNIQGCAQEPGAKVEKCLYI